MSTQLNREKHRLHTFKRWPIDFISIEKLAKTGLCHLWHGTDIVQCYFCGVKIGSWIRDDDEVAEHRRWSRDCPLLNNQATNNVPIESEEIDPVTPSETYDVCGYGSVPCLNVKREEDLKVFRDIGNTVVTDNFPLQKREISKLKNFKKC